MTKMKLAPIVLFTYNRLQHTKQTVEALQRNELAKESYLFVFSDGAKNDSDAQKVEEVRKYLKTINGFKNVTVIEREKNWGLANNIIDGVTQIVNKYGKIIVLEDDLVTSPGFLKYMNEALDMYADEERVASIHGWSYPLKNREKLPETFFIRETGCWGWATWARAWKYFEPDGKKLLDELKRRRLTKEFDFGGAYPYTRMLKDQIRGKNNSWAIRWYASAFLRDMLTLYPRDSLVRNIGLDSSGTHCGTTDVFTSQLVDSVPINKKVVSECLVARKEIEKFYRDVYFGMSKDALFNFIKRIFLRRTK